MSYHYSEVIKYINTKYLDAYPFCKIKMQDLILLISSVLLGVKKSQDVP